MIDLKRETFCGCHDRRAVHSACVVIFSIVGTVALAVALILIG